MPDQNPPQDISLGLIPSASCVLLRDGLNGLEVLLLKKNANITFGGSWVFPGGRIDDADADGDSVSFGTERNTVLRECAEETGFDIDAAGLLPISRWVTPVIRPKRFSTLFFLYDANHIKQEVAIDHGEIVDAQWLNIKLAISQHQSKEMVLAGPAFVTLVQLSKNRSTRQALTMFRKRELAQFVPRIQLFRQGAICLYQGDAAYDLLTDEETSDCVERLKTIERERLKHRLYMYRDQPWNYVNTT